MATHCMCYSFPWFWRWLYLLYLFSYGHVKPVSCFSRLVTAVCLFVYEYGCGSSVVFSWTVLTLRCVCLHRVGWTLKHCVIGHNSVIPSTLTVPNMTDRPGRQAVCPQQTPQVRYRCCLILSLVCRALGTDLNCESENLKLKCSVCVCVSRLWLDWVYKIISFEILGQQSVCVLIHRKLDSNWYNRFVSLFFLQSNTFKCFGTGVPIKAAVSA